MGGDIQREKAIMIITAEKVNGIWVTTENGVPIMEFGPGLINCLRAISFAARMRQAERGR